MCPACITTATLMFAGVTSAGGLTALVVKKIWPGRPQAKESEMNTETLATPTAPHRVVSRAQWIAARMQLLEKEKALTRQRDAINAERRELPWVKVEQPYVFDTPDGKAQLADLFDGRSQLIVYHFMFGPGWQEGCPSCSFLADHVDGALVHLAARDVSFVAVSRAPLAQIAAFRRRMGWHFKWVSSHGSTFNHDFHVSSTAEERAQGRMHYNYGEIAFDGEELHGTSAFYKDAGGAVFHTYSSYARGCDLLLGTYNWLDLAPKGRDEDGLGFTMAWVRHHDRYGEGYAVDPSAQYVEPRGSEAIEFYRGALGASLLPNLHPTKEERS